MDKSLVIGIQGGEASFHDTAAHLYFGENIKVVPCDTFRKLCQVVHSGEVDFAMMAIENSIAGSIIPNYSLIKEFNHHIIGEIKLRIMMNLMALPGQKVEEINKVMSHYMALLQCSDFLSQYPQMEEEKTHDTADSAKIIRQNNLEGVAAIAGKRAAKVYGLEILASEIETIKQNFTRFLVLKKGDKAHTVDYKNKAMLSFELPHKVGSLANILKKVVDYKINLTKIQSIPLIGKPDEYTFYIDCEFASEGNYRQCLDEIGKDILNLTILGEFQKGEFVYDRSGSK